MRISGTRELENLYRDLEGSGYTPSLSYEEVVRKLREDNVYLANMRACISFCKEKVVITIYDRYPDCYLEIDFRRKE